LVEFAAVVTEKAGFSMIESLYLKNGQLWIFCGGHADFAQPDNNE